MSVIPIGTDDRFASGGTPGSTRGLPAARCIGCRKWFRPTRHNQTRCKPNCGRDRSYDKRSVKERNGARAVARTAPKTFVAIDGEGVTDSDGTHRYVLLSCGDKHLSMDGAHLEFGEILEFLWSCYQSQPNAVYVGFYLGYDFAQWLRTLPENRARALFDAERRKRKAMKHLPPFPVEYGSWEFDYLPGKRFKFRPRPLPRRKPPPFMYVNDCGSYFQSTFLKAIDPRNNPNPVCDWEEYRIVETGKARRRTAIYDPEMVHYNLLECEILARLMRQLESGAREQELKPSRSQWHGPGQLAQMWLRKAGAAKGEAVREAVPEAVREAARASYYGGWFELFWHGPAPGKAWEYDINSAYPWQIAGLPCLLHGTWEREDWGKGRQLRRAEAAELGRAGLAFVRARLEGKHPIVGAMLHRRQDRSILRPQLTEGWFVESELAAAYHAAFVDKIRLFERWSYKPCSCAPPLAAIADLYQHRLKVGKGTPLGKAAKLIYNAAAGKFQQSVGEPAYANPVYATLITSGCRTMITNAIATHPRGAHDLLMVATDGVTFKSEHPGLALDKEKLGAWSLSERENLSFFMPGFYWDDGSRAAVAAGEAPAFKSRGIRASDLAQHIAAIDAAWERFGKDGWPRAELDVAFQLVSPRQALQRGRWELCGTVSSEKRRVVNANPSMKRQASGPGRSRCWHEAGELVSLPYDGRFGDELRAFQADEFGDHPDGPVGALLAEAFGVAG